MAVRQIALGLTTRHGMTLSESTTMAHSKPASALAYSPVAPGWEPLENGARRKTRAARPMKRVLIFNALVLAGCTKPHPASVEDTEGRVFSVKCEAEVCTLTQTDGPKAKLGRPRLHTTGRVISVCDASSVGAPPAPDACRPVVCADDRDCPALDGGKAQATCSRGSCVNPGEKLRVGDAVTLCLAGTGLGRRTAKQAERYALGLNCGNPCVVPSVCRQP